MSSKTAFILSREQIRILAQMPFACGSRPVLPSAELHKEFGDLYQMGLIDGAEGCYSVRWGLLTDFQDRAVRFWRGQPLAERRGWTPC